MSYRLNLLKGGCIGECNYRGLGGDHIDFRLYGLLRGILGVSSIAPVVLTDFLRFRRCFFAVRLNKQVVSVAVKTTPNQASPQRVHVAL